MLSASVPCDIAAFEFARGSAPHSPSFSSLRLDLIFNDLGGDQLRPRWTSAGCCGRRGDGTADNGRACARRRIRSCGRGPTSFCARIGKEHVRDALAELRRAGPFAGPRPARDLNLPASKSSIAPIKPRHDGWHGDRMESYFGVPAHTSDYAADSLMATDKRRGFADIHRTEHNTRPAGRGIILL